MTLCVYIENNYPNEKKDNILCQFPFNRMKYEKRENMKI